MFTFRRWQHRAYFLSSAVLIKEFSTLFQRCLIRHKCVRKSNHHQHTKARIALSSSSVAVRRCAQIFRRFCSWTTVSSGSSSFDWDGGSWNNFRAILAQEKSHFPSKNKLHSSDLLPEHGSIRKKSCCFLAVVAAAAAAEPVFFVCFEALCLHRGCRCLCYRCISRSTKARVAICHQTQNI